MTLTGDDLFVIPLAGLRKRRANVGRALRNAPTSSRAANRLCDQYRRTFYALTAVECRLYERIGR